MKAEWTLAALGLLLAGTSTLVTAQEAPGRAAATSTTADRAGDERAIRDAGAEFVRAYNAGDAGAIASLFTEDAEVFSEDGNVVEGRAAITAHFAESFEANPGETIEIQIDSLRFLGPQVAKEEGRAR